MPRLQPQIKHVDGPMVADGPLPLWHVTDNQITMGLPGLGCVEITASEISVRAPDEASIGRTWARLGNWATGQWYVVQGCIVLPGATVARDGRAVAIVGASRMGCSTTALQLTRSGFKLLSDGFTIIDDQGVALGQQPRAAIDTRVAERLFTDLPRSLRDTATDRVDVTVPGAGDCTLTAGVLLKVSGGLTKIMVYPMSSWQHSLFSSRLRSHALSAVPVPASLLDHVSALPSWMFVRSHPQSMDEIPLFGPPALARAINEQLVEVL